MPYGTVVADVIQNTTGYSLGAGNASAMKNRIINGAMVIDQRNAGASVTITNTAATTFTIDRWAAFATQASKFSVQQDAGAVTPPVGFTDYLGVTSLAATSLGSSDQFQVLQPIEGFNIADLGWGTANAKTVTISFWVRSSLTGTFAGSLRNSAITRSYPFTYTISVANTWELKSVTIAGDTSGTWLTTNGVGVYVGFSLGMGSTFSGTANAWAGTNYSSATGATSVVGTNGATFYITGVQLEVGSSATGFEYRQYGTELALCQRYFETSYDPGQAVGSAASTASYTRWSNNGTANALEKWFRVTKRALPTVNTYDTSGNAGKIRIFDSSTDPNNITPTSINTSWNSMFITYNGSANGMQFVYTASAEL
jgi:hypothetical protein